MDIVKMPERKEFRPGTMNRSRVQYAMVNAFVTVRIVEIPAVLQGQPGALQGGLIASKGSQAQVFEGTLQTTPVPAAGTPYLPGGVLPTFQTPAFVPRAELTLPVLVEPWAVSDQVFVQSQLFIDVDDQAPILNGPIIIVDFEVWLVAAGLQTGI
jgi:hypothetical protein